MDNRLSFSLYNHHGEVFDGEQYHCFVDYSFDPLAHHTAMARPEDEILEGHVILTLNYIYEFRPVTRPIWETLSLHSSQLVLHPQDFIYFTEGIVSEMFAGFPWPIPQDLISLMGPWLQRSGITALISAYTSGSVISTHVYVTGPYHPRGDNFLLREYRNFEYEWALENLLERDDEAVDGNVELERTCPICWENLDDGSSEAVRTPCLHRFHNLCIREWLMIENSCPNCRSAVVTDH